MKVLVTGGAGYIGSVVVAQLLLRGFSVTVVDDLSEGHRAAVGTDADFIEGDFGDAELVRGVLRGQRIDAVIHMAAAALVEESMREPRRYFGQNVAKSLALLDAMLDCAVTRFVMSSTAAVYGEPKQVPISEDHAELPINNYGLSKLMLERVLKAYHAAYGLKYIALRYFNAAGATCSLGEDRRHETHVVPLLLHAAAGRGEFSIFGSDYDTPDGTCVRDYIHVSDLASAHVLALEHLERLGAMSLNLGTGGGTSVRELVDTARRVTGQEIPVRHRPRRAGDPSVLVASAVRANAELGWRPMNSDPETIIRSAWTWRRTHPHGYAATPPAQTLPQAPDT